MVDATERHRHIGQYVAVSFGVAIAAGLLAGLVTVLSMGDPWEGSGTGCHPAVDCGEDWRPIGFMIVGGVTFGVVLAIGLLGVAIHVGVDTQHKRDTQVNVQR